ncbi:MAG: leucine-rich repeat protein [Anaerostipes sp.]|nr:leucine-rich repeat protein [Anaerostipes sp.]
MHEKKRILSLILALCMVVTMTVMPVSATEKTTKENTTGNLVQPAKGDGTKEDPYQIANADNLYWFAATVNGTDNLTQNKSACATLVKDITVNTGVLNKDGTLNGNGENFRVWTPIGTDRDNSYEGTFDGKGHTIKGVYVDSTNNYVGLFGYNKSGTIENVNVVDSYFKGQNNVGGLSGINSGSITNCTNSGSVSGVDDIGGVSGDNSFNGIITNCTNSGNVNGMSYYVGGVSGSNFGSITNCTNSGSVSGANNVGGVSGNNNNSTDNCSVSNCTNSGSVSGANSVGGVNGYNYNGTITNCINSGSVSGANSVGGVNGYNNEGTITNCYYDKENCTALGINGEDVTGSAEGKSSMEFVSGEITWLLNGSKSTPAEGETLPWGQTLSGEKADAYPVLGGATVYQVDKYENCIRSGTPTTGYSNTNETIFGSHTYGDPTLTWTKNAKTGGYDCTAKRTCTVDSAHVDEKSCTVTSVTKQATLYESGKITYTAKVSFDNKEYTDTKEVIIPQKKNIASAGVSGIYSKNYTGKSQTQSKISLRAGSTTLKAGTDYTVSYTNNKYIGTATITITGKGNYGGTLKKTFKITISKGKTYTVSSKKYKVTNASTNGKGTVTLTGVTTSKSKLTSLSIGNTVKIGNKTFKITAIGSNVCKSYTKLKKVTIGNNVTSIGKYAFYNCKKLSKLTIKSTKLKSVGSKAIKNIKKNAKIDVPSKKVSKYKKLFKSRTGYKKTMKIK